MDEKLLVSRDLHRPFRCDECGFNEIEYKGIGEYQCKKCRHLMYDDYGLVRNYLEKNKGATQVEVSKATGVSKNIIREFLKESKLEIAANSSMFMSCELCGAAIRSGRYCSSCESRVRLQDAQANRSSRNSSVAGFGKVSNGSSGARRFER